MFSFCHHLSILPSIHPSNYPCNQFIHSFHTTNHPFKYPSYINVSSKRSWTIDLSIHYISSAAIHQWVRQQTKKSQHNSVHCQPIRLWLCTYAANCEYEPNIIHNEMWCDVMRCDEMSWGETEKQNIIKKKLWFSVFISRAIFWV